MNRQSLMVIASIACAVGLLAGCNDKPNAAATPNTGTSSTPAAGKKNLPVGGKCVLLTVDQATALLGSTPKSSASGVGGEEIVHIDGCSYTGTAASLGYAINDYAKAGADPKTIVQQAKIAMSQQGVQPFDAPGGDDSVAFTVPIAGKTMARIELAKGTYTIGVNATAGDPAKAKQVALDALAILVAALG